MTKQEEIREGIAKLTEDRFRFPAEEAGLIWDKNFNYMLASNILSYLHSQGVVIKVDRELPSLTDASRCSPGSYTWNKHIAEFNYQQDMLRAGYGAFEPLIEEKQ